MCDVEFDEVQIIVKRFSRNLILLGNTAKLEQNIKYLTFRQTVSHTSDLKIN
jgi:hypothetical protein